MNSNMESNNKKVAGTINTAVGSLKEGAGRITGGHDLEAEGAVQKTKGQAQKFSAAIQDLLKKRKTLFGIKLPK